MMNILAKVLNNGSASVGQRDESCDPREGSLSPGLDSGLDGSLIITSVVYRSSRCKNADALPQEPKA
jgi:hypothetical protein